MDDTPVSFSDYKAMFSNWDASQVAVSASIACAAVVAPIIPSSKNKLIAAVVAGLGDDAHAMANNIYTQYDQLEKKNPDLSFTKLLEKIRWKDALAEGGVNFVITSISVGVVIHARSNPKFVGFAKKLEDKIKAQESAFLEIAGFSKQDISLLCEKLGIKIFKAVDFSSLDIAGALNHVKYRDLKVPRNKGIRGCHDQIEWAKLRKANANNYSLTVGKTLNEVPEVTMDLFSWLYFLTSTIDLFSWIFERNKADFAGVASLHQ